MVVTVTGLMAASRPRQGQGQGHLGHLELAACFRSAQHAPA